MSAFDITVKIPLVFMYMLIIHVAGRFVMNNVCMPAYSLFINVSVYRTLIP